MPKAKEPNDKVAKFTGIFVPAEVLAMKNLSLIDKVIISDIGYFNSNGYRVSSDRMAKKFGCSRRTIINSIQRLKSNKLGLIIDTGKDDYHRCLKLKGEISALFGKQKGANSAPFERTTKFQKPTAKEVEMYAQSIDFELDGQYFVDSYEAKGWLVGRTKMKDWRATIRTWKQRQTKGESYGNSSKTRQHTEAVEYIR